MSPPLHSAQSESDDVIIARIRSGDDRVLETVVHAYLDALYRFAYSYVHDGAIAEDIVQDVFIQLWNRRKSLSIQSSLRSYLFQSTRNRALNVMRHDRSQARIAQDIMPDILASFPDDIPEQRELVQVVRTTITALPPRTREILKLRHMHGLDAAEIAETLQVGVATVHNQLSVARKAIHQAVDQWRA